jgi:hypothetical protein
MPHNLRRLLLGLSAGFVIGWSGLRAGEMPAAVVAVHVKGAVEVQHGTATTTEMVKDGAQLAAADTVTTAAGASVVLVLPNGSVVSLREKSRVRIAKALQSPAEAVTSSDAERESGVSNSSFELAFGEMLTRVRKLNPASTFEVQTPVSVAAVRGTVFEVSYLPDTAGTAAEYRLSTARGLVEVTPHGSKMVKVGANEQVDFSARLAKKRVRVARVKTSKLDRHKQEQIEKEALDTERSALAQAGKSRAADADGKARTGRAEEKGRDKDPADPLRQKAKDAGADNLKAATPAAKKAKTVPPKK